MQFPGPVLLALSRTGMMRHSTATTDPAELLGEKVCGGRGGGGNKDGYHRPC